MWNLFQNHWQYMLRIIALKAMTLSKRRECHFQTLHLQWSFKTLAMLYKERLDSAEQTNHNDWWSTQKIWLVSEPIICIPDQKWSYEWWSGGGGGGGEMMAARIISLPLPIFSSHLWAKSKTSLVRWSPEWRSLQESAGTPTRPMMDEQVKERERKRLRPVQGNLGQDRKLEESKKM